MSQDIFKGQAKRLVEHMASVHGVKLKHNSALSAIAAIHGARDWNTLINTPANVLSRLARAFTSKPRLPTCFPVEEVLEHRYSEGLCFGVTPDASASVNVPYSSVRRHSLVVAAMGLGGQVLLEDLMTQHVANGGGMLVLDQLPNTNTLELLRAVCAQEGSREVQVTGAMQDRALRYDPVARDSVLGVGYEQGCSIRAKRLLAFMPPDAEREELDASRMHLVLQAVLAAIDECEEETTLNNVAAVLAGLNDRWGINYLLAHVKEGGLADTLLHTALSDFLQLTKMGIQVTPAFKSNVSRFLARLKLYLQSPYGGLHLREGSSVDFARAIQENQVLYASAPCLEDSSSDFVELLLRQLMSDSAVLRAKVAPDSPPFLVVVPMAQALHKLDLNPYLSQARGLNIAFVFHTTSLDDLGHWREDFAATVLRNTATKVFFNPKTARDLDEATAHLEALTRDLVLDNFTRAKMQKRSLLGSGAAPKQIRDCLSDLDLGQALFNSEGLTKPLRARMVARQ